MTIAKEELMAWAKEKFEPKMTEPEYKFFVIVLEGVAEYLDKNYELVKKQNATT